MVTVVEASVEDPVTRRLATVSVPEFVDDATERPPVTAADPWIVVLPIVVEARVDEPVVRRLTTFEVEAFVVVA